MLGFLKAIIILMFCVTSSAVFIRMIDRNRNMLPHVIAWGLMIPVIFLTQNYLLMMAILILIKIVYLKNDADKNIAMYLSLLVVMPFSFQFSLIPGVNLFMVSIVHMLGLIFLLPLLIRILRSDEFRFHHPDFIAIGLMLILLASNFRETSEYEFTWFQVFRDTFDTLFVVVVPYFVISRGIKNLRSLNTVLVGLLFGGMTMAFFAVFEATLVWRPYVEIGALVGTMPGIESMYEVRGGFLRVSGSLTGPITFGFYLTIVLATLLYFLRKNDISLAIRVGSIVFMLAILLLTGSRAALLGGLMFAGLYFLYSLDRKVRRVLMVPLILVTFAGIFISEIQPGSGQGTELEEVDQYGTFNYRKRLFFTSLEVIPDNLLLGTRKYRDDFRMQKMVQGQGIIDMVNGFIHITIEYGLIALALLLLLLLRSYRVLSREGLRTLDDVDEQDPELESLNLSNKNDTPQPRILGEFEYAEEAKEQPVSPRMAERWKVYFSQVFAALLISLCLQFSFTSYSSTIIPLLWITLSLIRAFQLIISEEEYTENEGYELEYE